MDDLKPILYSESTYKALCDKLADMDEGVAGILDEHGYPEFWHREPGFPCLVRIILEQQVSVASAYATYVKLEKKLGRVTPEGVLSLGDEELKTCGFSRQKTAYARALAEAVHSGNLDIEALSDMSDEAVRTSLIAIKGIGEWTVNVYLLLSLHRLDVFPSGDLALVKSMRMHGFLGDEHGKDDVLSVAGRFSPYRSILALLLWHGYLAKIGTSMP